jgi:TolB-like protein
MGWSLRWAAAASLSLAVPLHAQNPRATIVVLPFENTGSYGQDKETFEALEVGLPAILSATLAAHPAARVVDRSGARPQRVAGRRIDAASATELAKAAGARYAVTGSFADFYGKFRINARVVDAETGQILKVVSNDDPKLQDRAQLGAIVQLVGERIIAAVGLPPFPPDVAERARSIPPDALTDFSRGLMFEDHGDKDRAADAYQRALTAYPDYPEARSGLQRVRGPS